MANSALGSALTIPQSALDAIERADKKLKDIQDTAKNTATSVTKSFDSMAIGTKPFLDTLDQVINKLNIVGASATNASGGLNNIGASAGTMSGNIIQASMNVQNMVAQLSKMNGSGTSGIMQAVLAFQRLQEATKGASGMNIAELKQEIGAIDSMLRDVDYNLTKTDQESLIKRKKMLQDELKYQQQMYEERVIAFQKALDKMVSAESSFNAKQRKAAEERAKMHIERNKQENTSYEGSLKFADSASTLNRMTTAVSYLNAAKKQLSVTDENYDAKVQILDAKIHNLTLTMKQLSMTTEQRIAAQKAVDKESEKETNRAIKEDAANQKRIQSIRALNAEMNRQRNFETNTSFSGSLKFADTANTYNRQAKAVEYLTIAKKSLSQTDSDYQSKVDVLTSKISSLTNSMKERMMTSEQIAEVQKKIDDEIKKEIENYAKEQDAYRKRMQALREMRIEQSKMNNYKANTTIEGALKFSDTANTINRRTKAIQYLQEARSKLSSKSKTYADDESRIRKAIDRLTEANRNAIASTEELARKRQIAYEKQARLNKENNYKKNTTYEGALNFSATANTLNRQVRAIEYLKEARMKLSTADADYKHKLDTLNAAIAQHTKNLKEAEVNTKQLGEQTSYMSGYLSRWAQRMAFAFSINSIKGFVEQVAEVRGQFELSQRSLEAILQNKPKADEIFNKTVELAVKSPFRIKDLVDYTRQLSAYRIESDKLYDTTKRLADVSAGLGVDMGRLILAYGQVKAAAYLRGSEVRQFTEAGVNMYGELQEYFKEVKGEAYTTAQIVDMISKRKVTFEDVEAIFQRMTDKGGTFYNMQAIQAETLQGKISNLKDAFDVMLNDIGKANEGTFKGMISSTTELLNHWEQIANAAKSAMGIVALMALYMKQMGTQKVSSIFTSVLVSESGKAVTTVNLLKNTLVNASKYVTMFGANLKAAFMTNLPLIGIMAAVSAVYSLVNAFVDLREAQVELGKKYYINSGELNKIAEAYDNIGKSAKKSAKDQKDSDTAQDIQDKRKQIEELVKVAGSNGLSFDVNINVIKPENLDKTFEDLKSQYKEFINQMAVIENNRATNKFWKDHWYVPVDDFEKDAKQYSAAAANMMAHASDIDDAVAAVSGHMEEATDKTRKYYEEVKRGKKDGESELDYYERMYNLLTKIGKLDGSVLFGSGSAKIAARLRQSTLFDLAGDLKVQREELNGELDDMFKTTSDRLARLYGKGSKKYRILMSAEIDSQNLNRQVADLAKKRFDAVEIPTKANKEGAEREIKTIIQDLQDYARKNKINLSVEVDDPKNLIGTIQGYQKSAKDWQETIDSMERSNKRFFTGAYLDIGNKESWNGQNVDSRTVFSKELALKYAKEQKEAALYWIQFLGGKDPFAEKGSRSKANKAQRDILQERISLLKDMNAKYNELIKVESKEQALTDTRKYFKEAAQNVGWNAGDILPDDTSVIKRIREIGAKAKDIGKRGGYFRIAADIEFNIKDKEYTQLKDEVSQNIEDAFSGLDLFKKLKSEGLSEGLIKSMFGDIATSFADVNKKIDEEFNKYTTKAYETKYGKDKSKWSAETLAQYKKDMANTASVMQQSGEEVSKDYAGKQKKLAEKIKSSNINTFVELTKAYKTQLTEQLQLDKWYAEEKIKIQENVADPKLQKEYLDNLTKQYNQKTSENEWKSFQNSDMYIAIFENLDQASSRVLTAMKQKLESLRTSLKDLSPEQLKQIVNQIENIDEKLVERNPFDGLGKNFSKYISFATTRKQLEEDYAKSLEKETQLEYSKKYQGNKVNTLEAEYNKTVEIYGANSKQAQQAKLKLQIAQAELDVILQQAVAQGKITEKQAEQIRNGQKIQKTLQDQLHSMGQGFSEVSGTISSTFEMLNDWGLNIDMSDEVQEVLGGLDKIGSSLDSIDLNRPFSVIKGTIGVIGGIGKTLGGIFGWGTKDKRLQREIERHQKAIEKLQDAYNDLKEAMDNAYDIAKLSKYSDEMVKNLELQNQNLQSMIAAENEKKKSDNSKKEEWQKQIEANNKAIKEAEETLTEQLGGFGTKANYKSAAEAFADVWMDAYNENSDGLEALNDKFNEYFNNLLKKQLMARAAAKFIQPILDAVDAAVAKGSEGGNDGLEVTSGELKKLQELKNTNLQAFNEYANTLMKVLGVTSKGASNLSNLQQGIQSVSEATAQALESIINSIRYFVAQQQSDIAAIRNILEARLGAVTAQGESGGSSNQMIALMEQQVGYLHEICDNWSSVLKGGHKQGGKGIKVFMS